MFRNAREIRAKYSADFRAPGLGSVVVPRIHVVETNKSPHAIHGGEWRPGDKGARFVVEQVAFRKCYDRWVFPRRAHGLLIHLRLGIF